MDTKIILKKLSNYYTIEISVIIIWSIITSLLSTLLMKIWGFEVWKTHTSVSSLVRISGVMGAFWVTVIKMPFIEEMAFRLFLDLKWKNIAISIFFIVYFNLGIFSSETNILNRFTISLVIFIISFYTLFQNKTNFYELVSAKTQQIIQTISIIAFGLYHITNFIPINIYFLFVYPIYIIPQIVSGYYLTKIRMEFGIVWSISYHMFNNLVPFILQALITNNLKIL